MLFWPTFFHLRSLDLFLSSPWPSCFTSSFSRVQSENLKYDPLPWIIFVMYDKLWATIIFCLPSVKWISWYISSPFVQIQFSRFLQGLNGEMGFKGLAQSCFLSLLLSLPLFKKKKVFYVNRSSLGSSIRLGFDVCTVLCLRQLAV